MIPSLSVIGFTLNLDDFKPFGIRTTPLVISSSFSLKWVEKYRPTPWNMISEELVITMLFNRTSLRLLLSEGRR